MNTRGGRSFAIIGGDTMGGSSFGSGESVTVWRPTGLPGVEVMHAERSPRRWRQFHERFSVVTAIQAASDVAYRGRVRAVASGDLLLLEPGEVHCTPRVHAPQTFNALCIEPATLLAAAAELGVPGAALHWREAFCRDQEAFASLAALHAALAGTATTLERQTRLATCLRVLLARHAEWRAAARGAPRVATPRHPAVRRARDYLAEHSAEDVSLDTLADVAALSKYHLARVFAAEVGVPPHAYLTELRVAAARRLLAAGRSVSLSAYTAGFATQTHLHRHFLRTWGVPPGRYARASPTGGTSGSPPAALERPVGYASRSKRVSRPRTSGTATWVA